MKSFECRLEDEKYEDASFSCLAFGHDGACDEFAEHCYRERDGWEWMPKKCAVIFVKEEGVSEEKKFSVETDSDPSFSCREMSQP